MPIRAGSLTLKMTPSFIHAHGTGLPAALALSGGFQIIRHALAELRAETELPPQTSRGRVMKTIAFVSWQIVDDDDISGPQRWRQR